MDKPKASAKKTFAESQSFWTLGRAEIKKTETLLIRGQYKSGTVKGKKYISTGT